MKQKPAKTPKYPNLFQPSHTFLGGKDGKMMRVKSFKAMLPVFNVAIELVWGQNEKVKQYNDSKGFVENPSESSFLICILNEEDATLAHELYHLVNIISKDLGFEEGHANEPQAYLIGYLFDEIKKVI